MGPCGSLMSPLPIIVLPPPLYSRIPNINDDIGYSPEWHAWWLKELWGLWNAIVIGYHQPFAFPFAFSTLGFVGLGAVALSCEMPPLPAFEAPSAYRLVLGNGWSRFLWSRRKAQLIAKLGCKVFAPGNFLFVPHPGLSLIHI